MSLLQSLLERPSPVLPATSRQDELEDAFRAWAHDPAKPDMVDLDHRQIPMVELSRLLATSHAILDPDACAQLGMPDGVSVATAATELLHATIDPDGPRCRSFRAAAWYLTGLALLVDDLNFPTGHPSTNGHATNGVSTNGHATNGSTGHSNVH